MIWVTAFEGYVTLNAIHSTIFPTGIGSSENILVFAPTGGYWHKAVDVISPMGFRVWKALEKSIAACMSTLPRRIDTLDELRSLQRQNEELRLLLNQYLASRINVRFTLYILS